MNKSAAIPVLMYHSVGPMVPDWAWRFLTVPPEVFEDHLRWLTRTGYSTISLADLREHVTGRRPAPSNSCVLTFDDGYLDNWTHAVPLLAKHGFKATVFVNPEFVDPRGNLRPTTAEVTGRVSAAPAIDSCGFMSWPELAEASRRGVLDIQSHLMTHTWYPISSEVVDFHRPGKDCYWLDWNAFPAEKPFYLMQLGKSRVPWGTPIYAHAKSMEAVRFFPDDGETAALVEHVARHGGEAFFQQAKWRHRLERELKRVRTTRSVVGSYETPEERTARLRFEIVESKRLIEEKTGHAVHAMAWPGGGYDQEAGTLALEFYRSITLSSRDESQARNSPGDSPELIKRIGVPCLHVRGSEKYLDGRYLIRWMEEFRRRPFARQRRQFLKAFNLAALALNRRSQSE